MADITIFEFDLTDAQFYAPFAGGGDATDETDDTDAEILVPDRHDIVEFEYEEGGQVHKARGEVQ
ncbi:MAG: hypothetical protein ABEJ48_00265, partial [Halobacteriales archaeon]